MFITIQGLEGLLKHLKDKDKREKKVALTNLAVKLGVSLVPLAGSRCSPSASSL